MRGEAFLIMYQKIKECRLKMQLMHKLRAQNEYYFKFKIEFKKHIWSGKLLFKRTSNFLKFLNGLI